MSKLVSPRTLTPYTINCNARIKGAGGVMRLLCSLGHIVAAALVSVTPAAARDLSPLEAVERIRGGYDPFRAPKPDRVPDDYVDGKPYWLPKPSPTPITREVLSSPAASAMAADKPLAGHDPYQRPLPDRVPDDYVDGRPYWLPGPELVRTPTGFVGYSMWEAEFGGRYFGSTGRTGKDLFGDPPGTNLHLNSRLTYRGLSVHAGEAFARIEHANGFFLKGYIGGGVIPDGSLQDEDFGIRGGYSSTNSSQRDGRLAYGAIDAGWAWRGRDVKIGVFLGYFHYFERVNAFGCTQTAANPFICAPGDFLPSTLLIREDTNWNAARFGFNTEWRVTDRWKLTAEFAWLPYVNLNAKDTHFQRIAGLGCAPPFVCDLSGPAPEHGIEALSSVQLEAMLSYAFTNALSAGVGGRYWNIHTNPGHATVDFPDIAAPTQLSLTFKTQRYGVFVQSSYKFGQLQPSVH
jgi:hypothetical protein